MQYRRLRLLFDRHYKEQLQLVDVLTDRIRILGGARQVFASTFMQGSRFACALRGSKAAQRLLRELLDAHESVLSVGRPNGSTMNDQWAHDFAVGQVVLTNDAQISSINDQLADFDPTQRILVDAVLDYE
jgi:starvation-inducible DNA-binding protein